MEDQLRELSRRIDADLASAWGTHGGHQYQVLEDLGVMPHLMDPGAFRRRRSKESWR
jgi:hypothetical protein